MSSIEKRLKKSLAQASAKFHDDQDVDKLIRISNEFEDLVLQGVAKKRGHNLLSLSDKEAHRRVTFNSK